MILCIYEIMKTATGVGCDRGGVCVHVCLGGLTLG